MRLCLIVQGGDDACGMAVQMDLGSESDFDTIMAGIQMAAAASANACMHRDLDVAGGNRGWPHAASLSMPRNEPRGPFMDEYSYQSPKVDLLNELMNDHINL